MYDDIASRSWLSFQPNSVESSVIFASADGFSVAPSEDDTSAIRARSAEIFWFQVPGSVVFSARLVRYASPWVLYHFEFLTAATNLVASHWPFIAFWKTPYSSLSDFRNAS